MTPVGNFVQASGQHIGSSDRPCLLCLFTRPFLQDDQTKFPTGVMDKAYTRKGCPFLV